MRDKKGKLEEEVCVLRNPCQIPTKLRYSRPKAVLNLVEGILTGENSVLPKNG